MRKEYLMIAVLTSCMCGAMLFARRERTPEELERGKIIMEEFLEKRSVYFKIRVKLVDEAGLLVKGMRVHCSMVTGDPVNAKLVSETKIVNGEYYFESQKCSSVILDFFSEDYHQEHRQYLRGPHPGRTLKLEGRTYIFEETVVFKEVGELGHLKEYDLLLQITPARGTRVMDMGRLGLRKTEKTQTPKEKSRVNADMYTPEGIRRLIEQEKERKAKLKSRTGDYKDMTKTRDLPKRRMHLELIPSDKPVKAELDPRGRKVSPENSYLEIVLDDDGCTTSGFLIYEADPSMKRHAFVYMSTAPEEGYQPRLRITKETLISGRTGFKPIFFLYA